MMWLVFSALFALWVLGLIAGVGGIVVHALLLAALVLLLYQVTFGSRATR
jgi:hypothetical protein